MNPLETLVSSMTLAELAAKTGTSVANIVAYASKGATAPKAKPATSGTAKAEAPKATKATRKAANTRTPEGRAAYDATVLDWLEKNTSKGNPKPANKVIEACGGTGLQARTALNRLIEAGKANFAGKARATKYWAT